MSVEPLTLPPAAPAPAPTQPRPTRVAEAGFLDWIDRAIALTALGTGLAAVVFATEQLSSLHWQWLLVVAGGLVASSLLMPLYAWSQRGVKVPATLYGSSVMAGLWTWQLAWAGGATDEAPWLWPCIGVSTCVLMVAWGSTVAMVHNLFCSAAYLIARLNPAGGDVGPLVALQDTLVVAVQPALLLVLFSYVRGQAARLDAWVADARRHEADAALRASLVNQRNQLDAVIHDEVMTTLVAAARSSGDHDPHVTDLATHAIASVNAQASTDENADAFPPANVVRLLADVVTSVSADARLVDRVDPMAPLVPHDVVGALAQAVREAVLNAERHASADEVVLTLSIQGAGMRVSVRAEVADNGVGFDPDQVPERRLGIRLSLRERMRAVGGDARLASVPGEGTRVTLLWAGDAGRLDRESDAHANRSLRNHPVLAQVALGPIGWVSGAAIILFTTVGLLEMPRAERPELIAAAVGLLCLGTPLVMQRFGRVLSVWRAAVAVACLLGVTALGILALPRHEWTIHGTWFIGTVCMLTVLIRAGSRRFAAWALALAAGAMLLAGAWLRDVPLHIQVGVALNPLGWLVIVEMLVGFMGRVQRQLDGAQRAADEASLASAASFARLVVREVWLADVRDQVGGMLDRLADPGHVITEEDREACLAMEGRLRDGIKAANFNAPALSAAIMEARLRGVQVTLVDNRGAALTEVVRRATLRHLEGLVRSASTGRIVARTAPEGYEVAVTIVQVDAAGSTMTTIDDQGLIEVSRA